MSAVPDYSNEGPIVVSEGPPLCQRVSLQTAPGCIDGLDSSCLPQY